MHETNKTGRLIHVRTTANLSYLAIVTFSLATLYTVWKSLDMGNLTLLREVLTPLGTITGMVLSFYFGTRAALKGLLNGRPEQ